MPCKKRYTVSKALKALDSIDKAHESGKITNTQHVSKSRTVLNRLVRSGRRK